MMKSEFENLYGKTVSPELYEQIELVYMYHPFFQMTDPDSKKLVADFCKDYLPLIQDLVATAKEYRDVEEKIQQKRAHLDEVRKEFYDLVDDRASKVQDYMEVR